MAASFGGAHAQAPTTQIRDSIFTLTRDTLLVNVTSVSAGKIYYTNPDSNNVERNLQRKVVQRIVFASGKVEVFNKPVFSMVASTDWRSIILTENPADVEGMHLRAVIIAASTSNVTTQIGARTSAETTAKKKAATNGGMYVLVKKRKELGGYGEVPKYYIEGEVYGTTALAEGQKMKDDIKRSKQKKVYM